MIDWMILPTCVQQFFFWFTCSKVSSDTKTGNTTICSESEKEPDWWWNVVVLFADDVYAMDEKNVRKTSHSFSTSVIIIFLMAFLVGVIVFSVGFFVFKRWASFLRFSLWISDSSTGCNLRCQYSVLVVSSDARLAGRTGLTCPWAQRSRVLTRSCTQASA